MSAAAGRGPRLHGSEGWTGATPTGATNGATPFLCIRSLAKRLGDTQALRAVDLDAHADELLVVLGPTGAGKTTLLRTIAGLETPDAGTIFMAGQDVTGLDPARRDVALVFQNFSLYPRWTVRRNMEFPLRAPGRNLDNAEIQRRVGWASELLKITRLLDREASRLSGGEMQRVAIGRAIVRRPRLFLMDEPLTNLDAKLREALRVELVQMRRELKTPMVFVTHDQAEALSMADRIVVLSAGRVLQTGTPRDIYERPVSPVVALQLGQPAINLLPVKRIDGSWVAGDGTPLLPAPPNGSGERLLGVRPEDIIPHRAEVDFRDAGSSRAPHQALVKIVEYIGPTTTLLCEWCGTDVHIVVPRRGAFRPGDRIHPRINAARAVLFEVGPGREAPLSSTSSSPAPSVPAESAPSPSSPSSPRPHSSPGGSP